MKSIYLLQIIKVNYTLIIRILILSKKERLGSFGCREIVLRKVDITIQIVIHCSPRRWVNSHELGKLRVLSESDGAGYNVHVDCWHTDWLVSLHLFRKKSVSRVFVCYLSNLFYFRRFYINILGNCCGLNVRPLHPNCTAYKLVKDNRQLSYAHIRKVMHWT